MKSHDELRAETELIQQQMFEADKHIHNTVRKEVRRLCKEFSFTSIMLKSSLAKRPKNQ